MNLSAAAADTITVTAGTGHTIVGIPIVQSVHSTTGGITGASSTWRTRKTAANTFVSYRVG
jgi:CO dehydrogenase/acetyl-CoA synthase alpha subunit